MWVPNLPVTVLSAVAATAGAVCIYKDRHSGPAFERSVSAEGKTVIITGANSGIGQASVWEFARRGAKVFMACRDMEKCEAARREIVLETNNKYVQTRGAEGPHSGEQRGCDGAPGWGHQRRLRDAARRQPPRALPAH
ncbi:hypothetical protein MSG28_006685 [Choristoneura fumiferana]|uniref:Uncharacterized protein n=1 Tax=Choristoneura fumiferana TaxID=7141 RepID=A0ACC0JKU4_CHOFU|nr:hypothetical protein MSG28_006685 [Choristoneura fumiferana]